MTVTEDADRKRDVASAFGEATDGYLQGAVLKAGADLRQLAAWCADATRALDVATGAGHTAGALREAGVETVVATDLAPEMVETAINEHGPLSGAVVDAERLPVTDGAFDAVTCRFAAHHFPDPVAFLAEAGRVLEPGGTLAISDLSVPDDPEAAAHVNRIERLRDSGHVESYSPTRWRTMVAEAGLELAKLRETSRRLDVSAWLDRMDVPDDRRETIRDLLADVPPSLDGHLDREFDGDELLAYRTPVVVLRATS